MFNVCPGCGEYRADKVIDHAGSYAVCPCCGYQHKFLQLPLFILTGASGVGKTTTCLALAAKTTEVVVMESDILWRAEFNQPIPTTASIVRCGCGCARISRKLANLLCYAVLECLLSLKDAPSGGTSQSCTT